MLLKQTITPYKRQEFHDFGTTSARLFRGDQPDHTYDDGERTIIVRMLEGRSGGNRDFILLGVREIGLQDKETHPPQLLPSHADAVCEQFHHRFAVSELAGMGKAANAKPLRTWPDTPEHGRGAPGDPTVLIAEIALQFVPAFAQLCGMGGQREIDHVRALARI